MTGFVITAGAIILLFIIWIMMIAGRTSNKKTKEFFRLRYAHRGLASYDYPENSLSAFNNSAQKGFGIELDVHLMRDSRLAVIHDSSLKRTAGADVKIEDLTEAELKNYTLIGTEEKIPTLREVLAAVDGRVPLLIELKAERGNAKTLCSALMYELRDYKGDYCIESFDPRCLLWFKKNRPEVVRGQLSQNFIRNDEKLSFPLRIILTELILNAFTQPDFMAFKYEDRHTLSNLISKNFWNMPTFAWTLKSPRKAKRAEKKGYGLIFENIE